MKFLCFIAIGFFAVGQSLAADEPAPRPNVIFLLADDLGWGDLSCHGSTFCRTPNIDELASQGIDFQRFSVASPVCSSSRTAFMTGCFPGRFAIHQAIGGVRANAQVNQADWLDPKAVTLPRLLKIAGYATGHVGKWHLQSSQADDAPMPSAYGIDEHALFAGTAHPHAEKIIEHDEIWETAIDFIKRHSAEPFYLNVWMHETHLAHYPSERSLKENAQLDERQRIYAAVATDADRGIGTLLAALRDFGLDQNTIVIFSSDNGPENTHRTMKEMRGGYGGYYSVGETGDRKGRKRSLYEGGVAVPLIVRWPSHVPAGRIDTATVLNATDLLPTLCAAARVALPGDYQADGENMLVAWQGEEVKRTRPIFWNWNGTAKPPTNWVRWAVRDGEWKLVADDDSRVELYRLSDDIAEQYDLAAKHPDIVQQLTAKLSVWRAELPKQPAADCVSNARKQLAGQRDQ